jgi:hypothetical protein
MRSAFDVASLRRLRVAPSVMRFAFLVVDTVAGVEAHSRASWRN